MKRIPTAIIAVVVACAVASCATATAPSEIAIPIQVAQKGAWIRVESQRYEAPAVVTIAHPHNPARLEVGAPGHETATIVLSPDFLWRSLLLFPLGTAIDFSSQKARRLSENPVHIDLRSKAWRRRANRYEEAYPTLWVATVAMSFPATGIGIGRAFGDWRVHGSVGTLPIPITGFGAALEISRGIRLGPLTLSPGLAAGGVESNHCSWGGCGEPFRFYGLGPHVGLEYWFPWGPVDAVAGAGGGVFVAASKTSNMHRVQPHVTLFRFGLGW